MKFKIYNRTTKITVGPFSMLDIKAYDGESHDIWFANKTDSVLIGDDLGHGRNNTEKIQSNLVFLPFTGICDSHGIELYNSSVNFIEDEARELQSLNKEHDLTEIIEAISMGLNKVAAKGARSYTAYSVEGFSFKTKQELLTYFGDLDYECFITQGMSGEIIQIKW